jgi:pyridoxamine 5'-phosphate oxidase
VNPNPLEQYRLWEAEAAVDVQAVALATATRDGAPSVRMVLLKQADERGFVFFTNGESRKGRELRENPRAAILVHWAAVAGGRQVRVEGPVERLPDEESDAYWATRPPRSRAAAYSSRQSEVLASREELERAVDEAERRDPPRPPHWGGFVLVPATWEFWQHGDDRLHDRCRYRREGGAWLSERLSP